ncbi:MAG: hypothetical protein RMJ53_05180 [Chitinophagales bacterium]|nr:hypothetical protein [Chitinophagales bacterium]MDW8273606.1 hypothetical protein [Chitinophagales bacterium]
MKKLFYIVLIVLVLGATFLAGMFYGANKVRNGLLANYPLFKKIISYSKTEVDSLITLSVSKKEHPGLALLFDDKDEQIMLTVPYHATYGMDLEAKNFKTDKKGDLVELMLPGVYLMNYSVAFDKILVNGKPTWKIFSDAATFDAVKPHINEIVRMPLEKNKAHLNEAKKNIAITAMWYLMPYRYNLRIFFNSQEFNLPVVPGINKSVEEYLKEQIAPKTNS